MKPSGNCPKCRRSYNDVQYTEHHILPKRFYKGSFFTIDLCRECHDKLELKIPQKEEMPRAFYFIVVNTFVGYEIVKDYG